MDNENIGGETIVQDEFCKGLNIPNDQFYQDFYQDEQDH